MPEYVELCYPGGILADIQWVALLFFLIVFFEWSQEFYFAGCLLIVFFMRLKTCPEAFPNDVQQIGWHRIDHLK